MSMYRHRDGLFWLSLFSIPSEKEKKQLLDWIHERHDNYTTQWLASEMLELSGNDAHTVVVIGKRRIIQEIGDKDHTAV